MTWRSPVGSKYVTHPWRYGDVFEADDPDGQAGDGFRKPPSGAPHACETSAMTLWAKYVLPGDPKPAAMWTFPMSRRGRLMFAILTLVGVLLFLALAGYGAWRYFRLSAWDDYRAGYSTGAAWRADGVRGDCSDTMATRYGDVGWNARAAGWGEFIAGCVDGRSGQQSASWLNLREHLWANVD
jgi:hypothetical protein